METSLREADILQVWDFWNDCNIVNHRELAKLKGVINGRLEFYTATELCQAIRNYKDVLSSERHWFSYTWTLKQFLSQTNALDNFMNRETALNRYRRGPQTKFQQEDESVEGDADFYRSINMEDFNCPGEGK